MDQDILELCLRHHDGPMPQTEQELMERLGEIELREKEKKLQQIQDRILKGAQMIEEETDMKKKDHMLKVYEALCTELERLREIR